MIHWCIICSTIFYTDERLREGEAVIFWYSQQIKGQWESNINVWFPFMYSQKGNCYFQKWNYNVLSPSSYTLIYLWYIFKFPESVCLFFCREIYEPILGIYKSLTDTSMWKLGLRPCNSQKRNTEMGFSLQCCTYNPKSDQWWWPTHNDKVAIYLRCGLEPEFVNVKRAQNRFQGIDSPCLCSLGRRYDKWGYRIGPPGYIG